LAVFVIARRRAEEQVSVSDQTDFSDALASALTASRVYEEEIQAEALADERHD
jgi:hypothetical protein